MAPITDEANSPEFATAVKFVNSPRGQYIMSQALFIAAMQLKTVELPYREASNIADMEFLLVELFPIYPEKIEAAASKEDDTEDEPEAEPEGEDDPPDGDFERFEEKVREFMGL